MIRVVVFDIGGVVLKPKTFHSLTKEYAKIMGRGEGEVYEIFIKYWHMWKVGKIDEKEFFKNLVRDLHPDADIERLRGMMYHFAEPDREILALIKKLRGRYKVFSLTNHAREFFGFLEKRHGLDKMFDRIFKSYETKLAKPDSRFFEHMLGEIKMEANECVFIDDKKENVEAARKLGIKSILHRSAKQTGSGLRKLGVIF